MRVVEHAARTDTGRQRRGNEDAYAEHPPLFAVADGMGGARAGEVASGIAVECLEEELPPEGPAEERLATAALAANARIHELSRRDRDRAGMGTTFTAALVDERDDEISVAHVGDSRLYRLRDDELEQLTRDHTLVQAYLDRGDIDEQAAAVHPQRNVITRALGPEPDVEVDTFTLPARDGDVFLVCSDGLTSMVDEDTMSRLLAGADGLADGADRLVDAANAAGGRDNITVLLFRIAGAAEDTGEQTTDSHVAVPPPPGPASARRQAPRRTAPLPPAAEAGRRRRRLGPLVALLAVLVIVGSGLWIATRAVYFVGTDDAGLVSVFRGVPVELPFGVSLYEEYYVSGVPASSLPPARRERLLDHELRSQPDASDLVEQLELGRLAGR